eukprot:4526139-Pyramimonas_sp.AAC.1
MGIITPPAPWIHEFTKNVWRTRGGAPSFTNACRHGLQVTLEERALLQLLLGDQRFEDRDAHLQAGRTEAV